ncbi:MAG: AmmeMemoRadiSam system protein B [Candidatus Krumholzibacteria bacterium]|nr:AmmeMemoRadiSam system protein B [Candidatus Krumholzibacteria bacterium]
MKVRKPAVAGQFYAADPASLRAQISELLDGSQVCRPPGEIIALICPHAGYIYSGGVAAAGYSLISGGPYETVVVIAPCHVDFFGYSSVYDGDAYETPLGRIPVDRELASRIAGGGLIRLGGAGHELGRGGRGEHSLEVQLPFLQVAIGEFRLVPIVMGDQSAPAIEALGASLARELKGARALIVASTDLSHFHDDRSARSLDGVFMENISSFDVEGLREALAQGSTEACGGGPAAAALIAAAGLGADRCSILRYATSGDVSGDRGNVVGYVSAAITRPSPDGEGTERSPGESAGLSARDGSSGQDVPREARIFLLRLARSVIRSELGLDAAPPPQPESRVLGEKRGGFVTLKRRGQLRGCIGYIEAIKPLAETVEEMARAAAFRDTRFRPVTAREIDDIEIEISVLGPVETIDDPGAVDVGRHGIIISAEGHRGLLLPQVAAEWGWDRETFLDQTCVKAGLPPNRWRGPGVTIEVFSAEIFSEKELGLR